MDALKKAELAKGAAAADRSSTPDSTTSQAPATLPDLPLKLEELDGDFTAEVRSAPNQRPQTAPSVTQPPPVLKPAQPVPASRAAAQNTFAAKQQPATERKTFAVAVGAVTLVAIAAIGIYFWLQLKPSSSGLAVAPSADLARTAPPANVAPPPAPRETVRATPAAVEPMPVEAQEAPTKAAAGVVAVPTRPSPRAANDPIRITTSHLKVNPALTDGFNAFQAGDLTKARAAYERALQDDPYNADALRGAAAVALREGRRGDAEAYYRRLIEADPLDATAQAGLVGLDGRQDPVATEGRLKTLLASQPDAAVLHFALGNLYARQGRWPEAQQAYFDAVNGDGDNPDYLYNLAVSLDQLHKTSLAAQYYRQALAAAAKRPAGFDQTAAATRLRQLQP